MARPTPKRKQFHYIESWMLPSVGLRATIFHFNAGYERDQDYYLDVGEYTPGPTVWRSEDHYLDLVIRTGVGTYVTDVDELLAAVRHRLLPEPAAERAIVRAVDAVDGLARHGHDLHRWLSTKGMALTWRDASGFRPSAAGTPTV